MSSTSPGHVTSHGDPEDVQHDTLNGVRAPAQVAGTPVRTATQKRARGSPAPPTPARALALLGSLTETVRANAARGLRALSDSIERPRAGPSQAGSDDSTPPSPTEYVNAVKATPASKRRRTALTDARARESHADWRGAQWDYSGAMKDDLFYRVGDTGPSAFAFPPRAPDEEAARGDAAEQEGAPDPASPIRPPSAMSTASAPAALTTPSAHDRAARSPSPMQEEGDEGWVTAVAPADDDPFGPAPLATATDGGDADVEQFVGALRTATALLSPTTVGVPDACGALLAFQARLRALDPQGNFVAHCPAGEHAASSLRELRAAVAGIAAAQRECTLAVRALTDRAPVDEPPRGNGAPQPTQSPPPRTDNHAAHAPTAAPPAKAGAGRGALGRAPAPPQSGTTPTAAAAAHTSPPSLTKAVGRHDPRRAVFCPALPFGGRIPSPASAEAVRRLNSASYQVRDAVNAALRDRAVEVMDDAPDFVQVAAVNWTERGNLCMITHEDSVAAQLLLHADAAAHAAELGPGWRASRDVPVHKVVLCNVPTQRADGTLFTEDDVLDDLRAHSSAFKALTLADSMERAGWISRADRRALKDRSSLVVNLATADDASRLLAMKRCLFALGCPCEPEAFQPRERERICRRCWNPLARHCERDYVCKERCRLCSGGHAEEDHTCAKCDVLARPCEHIPLRCVNCRGRHAADDAACEYRRRVRGTAPSAPPMSAPAPAQRGNQTAPPAGKKKGKRAKVRVLDPHEPFPDDPPPALPSPPSPARDGSAPPTPPAADAAPTRGPPTRPVASTARAHRAAARRNAAAASNAADTAVGATTAQTPQPPIALQGADTPAPARTPTPPPAHTRPPSPEAELLESERVAIAALVGDGPVASPSPPPPAPASTQAPEAGSAAPQRRIMPARGSAAADAAREDKRRLAAHVLHGRFGKLKFPDIMAALRRCSDDYASVVSWAAEEMAKKMRPGMQGASENSLQKLVLEMAAAAASDKPAKGTDKAPAPAHA